MRRLFLFCIVFLAIALTQQLAAAPPPPPGAAPPCWPPPCIPIDGGISALIVAGAAYGAKKLYSKKKKADLI